MSHESKACFVNARVLLEGELHNDLAVTVKDGLIQEIGPASQAAQAEAQRIDLQGNWLLPGFIDVQVNGGGGVLFNDEPSVEGITRIAEAHRRFGSTGLLPTLISDDLAIVQQGLHAVHDAIEQGVPGVLGIHIEGPFLNPDRRGVHDTDRIRHLDGDTLRNLQPLDNGVTLITLAPERVEPGMVRELVKRGFVVSAGHSNAGQARLEAALGEGLRGVTHLYNAMSQLTAREPGVVGTALAEDDLYCGIIADGHHVAAASVDIAWRCKGSERLMLVTDAMPNAGTDLEEFMLQGKRIIVKDGVCQDEHGTLAGAALDLVSAVRNMMAMTACTLGEAVAMASKTPAEFLGLTEERGSIAIGKRADFVVTSPDLQVQRTYIGGHRT